MTKYGEKYKKVTAKPLRRWTLQLSDVVTDSKAQKQKRRAILAAVWLTQNNTDPQCLPKEESSLETGRLSPTGDSCAF